MYENKIAMNYLPTRTNTQFDSILCKSGHSSENFTINDDFK